MNRAVPQVPHQIVTESHNAHCSIPLYKNLGGRNNVHCVTHCGFCEAPEALQQTLDFDA